MAKPNNNPTQPNTQNTPKPANDVIAIWTSSQKWSEEQKAVISASIRAAYQKAVRNG